MEATKSSTSKRVRAEEDPELSLAIEALTNESNFQRRQELMNKLQSNLARLSTAQITTLCTLINEDRYGLFNRTWGTLSFALKVLASRESSPGMQFMGFPVRRIRQEDWGKVVGKGATGAVREATLDDERKAVKFLDVFIDSVSEDEEGSEAMDSSTRRKEKEYLQEVLLLSQVNKAQETIKPFCVSVDCLVLGDNGSIGLVMPLYNYDLHKYLCNHGQTLDDVQRLRIFRRCVECVAAVHNFGAKGHLHNDIKAENFLLGPCNAEMEDVIDSLVITDFGFSEQRVMATMFNTDSEVASLGGVAGRAKGTAAYASPEVAAAFRDGDPVLFTKQSDIFSLGVVLGYLLTNVKPFAELSTPYQILTAIKKNRPRFTLPDAVPPLLQAMLVWCMKPRREDRPSSCDCLISLMDTYALNSPPSAIQCSIESMQGRICYKVVQGLGNLEPTQQPDIPLEFRDIWNTLQVMGKGNVEALPQATVHPRPTRSVPKAASSVRIDTAQCCFLGILSV
ncbi:non-specific serine/threonine protein kinase [Balamuthia mandrillaris]